MRRFLAGLVALGAAIGQLATTASAETLQNALDSAATQFHAQGGYHPVPLTRVLDTRTGIGGTHQLAPAVTRMVKVAGLGAVPSAGVAAVVVNVTVLSPERAGSVSVWRGNTAWDASGTISFSAGHTAQNQLVAALGTNGGLAVRNNIGVPVDLVADVSGYFESGQTGAGGYLPLARTRVLDTRSKTLSARSTRTFQVAGIGAVPAATVSGTAALNVTVLNPAAAGSVSVYDGSVTWNRSASVTFGRNTTEQDVLYRGLAPDGTLTVRNNLAVPVTVIVDVFGEFTGCGRSAGLFCSSDDFRSTDTRAYPNDQLWPQSDFAIYPGPDRTRVPWSGITAEVIHLTLLSPSSSGSVSMWTGGHPSAASTVTYVRGVTLQRSLIAPVGTDDQIWLHNYGSASMDVIVDVVGYLRGHDSPVTETSYQLGDPRPYPPTHLSCADPQDCLAVGPGGAAGFFVASHQGEWGHADESPVAFPTALSCPEPAWCLVTGQHDAAIYDGIDIGPPSAAPFAQDALITAVSCASPTYCMVLAGDGTYSVYDGRTWTAPASPPTPAILVSCPAAADCFLAARGPSAIEHLDGTTWTSVPLDVSVRALACGSRTLCMAGGPGGRFSRFDGTEWSAPVSVLDRSSTFLACAGSSFCYASSGLAVASRFDGGAWAPTAAPPSAVSTVSCSAPDRCVLLGGSQLAESHYDGTSWSARVGQPQLWPKLTAIGCASSTLCVLGYDSGRVSVGAADGNWPLRKIVSTNGIASVGCSSDTRCLAADAAGYVYSYEGGSWSTAVAVDPGHRPVRLSCSRAGSSMCALVTADGRASIFGGARWSDPVAIDTKALVSVSCAGGDFCAALDADGGVVSFSAGHWSAVVSSTRVVASDISCPSPGYCMVTGSNGDALLRSGVWHDLPLNGAYGSAVQCPQIDDCYVENRLAVDSIEGNGLLQWDGSTVSFETPIDADVGDDYTTRPNQLSCPTPTRCVAIGAFSVSILGPRSTG